jgi:predicted homoserine dehydrogenase-like protein
VRTQTAEFIIGYVVAPVFYKMVWLYNYKAYTYTTDVSRGAGTDYHSGVPFHLISFSHCIVCPVI